MTEIYFSQFWRLRIPKSRHRQVRCLARACFLVHRQLSFYCVLTWWKGSEISLRVPLIFTGRHKHSIYRIHPQPPKINVFLTCKIHSFYPNSPKDLARSGISSKVPNPKSLLTNHQPGLQTQPFTIPRGRPTRLQ